MRLNLRKSMEKPPGSYTHQSQQTKKQMMRKKKKKKGNVSENVLKNKHFIFFFFLVSRSCTNMATSTPQVAFDTLKLWPRAASSFYLGEKTKTKKERVLGPFAVDRPRTNSCAAQSKLTRLVLTYRAPSRAPNSFPRNGPRVHAHISLVGKGVRNFPKNRVVVVG